MKPVCEVMVQHIFPSVRAIISRELIYEYKLNQNEVARLLGVSQPAISQYLRQLRGDRKTLLDNEHVSSEVKKLCKRIYDEKLDRVTLMSEFCKLCNIITNKGLVCQIHNEMYKLKDCCLCTKGGNLECSR
jgi:predicted transcriptional regulator